MQASRGRNESKTGEYIWKLSHSLEKLTKEVLSVYNKTLKCKLRSVGVLHCTLCLA